MTTAIRERPTLLRPRAHSPFEKIIAFGYDDGPTFGIVRDENRPAAYRFDLLAVDIDGIHDREAWDRGEEIRIFGLTPLPAGAFERIVEALSTLEPPRWPVWVPGMPEPSPAMRELIDREIVPLLDTTGPVEVVAASNLLGPILAAEPFPTAALTPGFDWFAFLGFATPATLTIRA